MPTYVDLLVTEDDLTLDAGGNPCMVYDRDCIAQDLVHMIRESGLLVEMVADRDQHRRAENCIRLELAVEEDERIVPGSVTIEEPRPGEFFVQAETVEFGPVGLSLEAKK